MPHVIVKMWPGRAEQQKTELTHAIVRDVVTHAKCEERSVSVSIQEVTEADWAEQVYKPDVLDGAGTLYKKPGYNPFDE